MEESTIVPQKKFKLAQKKVNSSRIRYKNVTKRCTGNTYNSDDLTLGYYEFIRQHETDDLTNNH
jgi:hypothetical protein